MPINKSSGYGAAQVGAAPLTLGKVFVVSATTGAAYQDILALYTPDYEGVARNYTTPALALAQTVAGRGDILLVASDYVTALTTAELASADTNGVRIYSSETARQDVLVVTRPTAAMPATTTAAIFNVLGTVKIIDIIGIVTTVIQTQACNLKINTYHGSTATDICADLNVTAKTVNSRMSITGTFANALINTAAGVPVAPQATSIVVQGESTLRLTTSATNTGSIRWIVRYEPMDIGARIVAA